jgi:hypothetical protein
MNNRTAYQSNNLGRYEIISKSSFNENNFYSPISFNNFEKTTPPDLEKEALLVKCLFWLRDLYFLQPEALMEASDELKDIVIYHQDFSRYAKPVLPAKSKIVRGEIAATRISKPPQI